MKTYTLTELEMDTISDLNTGCATGLALATLFYGAWLGFLAAKVSLDLEKASPEAKVLLGPGSWVVLILGIAFTVYAVICYCRSGGMTKKIKKESESEVTVTT